MTKEEKKVLEKAMAWVKAVKSDLQFMTGPEYAVDRVLIRACEELRKKRKVL